MTYLTQKKKTKLWIALSLAALVLTALLWLLLNRVTFTTAQAVRQAAQMQQIAPLTQLEEKEVPGFHFLLTGNQDNLLLLGWGEPLYDRWTRKSNPILSLDLTAGDPALQVNVCTVWDDTPIIGDQFPDTLREILSVMGTSDLPQATSVRIEAAFYDWDTRSPSTFLWEETVPLTQRTQGDAFFWLVRDGAQDPDHPMLHFTITLLDASGKTLVTTEHIGQSGTARPINNVT